MQSHQSSFSSENNKNTLGHRRRPSIGKSMPVTSLLLNFPPPPKGYETLARDGASPESEKPPIFFRINELNNDSKSDFESSDDNIEDDYEILISECSSNEEDKNDEKLSLISKDIEDIKLESLHEPQFLLGNIESTNCVTCIDLPKNTDASSATTPVEELTPLKELCEKLCNNDCKNTNTNLSDMEDLGKRIKKGQNQVEMKNMKSLLKVPSKLDLERKKFLDEILQDVELDRIANIDFGDLEVKKINTDSEYKNFQEQMDKNDFRDKFMINKTSMMTSPAAKRRLAARKIEMELDFGRNRKFTKPDDKFNEEDAGACSNKDSIDFVPPRDLLLYLVRMGSFNSAPKINNTDSQDDNLILPPGLTTCDLIEHFKTLRGESRPQLLTRYFMKPTLDNGQDFSDGFRFLNINSVSRVCSPPVSSPKHIRIFQWNILSQSLGQNNDGFVCCPDEALTWENRKFLIVQEILQNNPDIICLQEVDHFKFLERILGSQNYCGIFFPKPDSPCLYIEENNGPDGCAIFYKRDKFELLNFDTRVLEVWHVQSNQVAIVANMKVKETGKELTICTTHLKARSGALLSKLRNEQGKDLLKFLNNFAGDRPVLLCGDFNAEPIEPVYSTVLSCEELGLSSAYADINEIHGINGVFGDVGDGDEDDDNNKENINEKQIQQNGEHKMKSVAEVLASKEPPYTTWKIREEGEVCHTIDYVFYSKNHFRINNCLLFPQSEEIGKNRTPSYQYPSDHFSLVCDFEIVDKDTTSIINNESCTEVEK